MTINRDVEPEPGISTFAKRRAPLHRHATPFRTERDLADTVDENRPSSRRCDRKTISRTNNFYEVYPAAEAGGYAWNVALLAKSNIGPDDGGFNYEMKLVPMREQPDIVASVVSWGASVSGTAREILSGG